MLRIKVTRDKRSLDYRGGEEPSSGDAAWHVNDKNNSLDSFDVFEDGALLFHCSAQTVANMEGLADGTAYAHTVAPGPFMLRVFVDPRQHYGRVHGLCRCYTLGGDYINADSVTENNALRWLVHDWRRLRPNTGDTRVAWSDGCFVIPDADLDALGVLFYGHGVEKGALIQGVLEER